jgi:DNA-binding transcriptional MerR regulator
MNYSEKMALSFLKKEHNAPEKGSPVNRVRELTSKGFSELEVIDVLRKEGYSPEEIDSALSQALKGGITSIPQQSQQKPQSKDSAKDGPKLPTLEDIAPQKVEMPEMPESTSQEEYYEEGEAYPTEEYIEYVVKEKTGEVKRSIDEFSLKTKDLEKRIDNLHEQINILIQTRTTEQTQLLNRIDSFKGAMEDIEIRLGGIEKAFKDTLPALIESVRALSDLVGRARREA